MAEGSCVSCHEPLYMEIEPDSDIEEDDKAPSTPDTVPDDVELNCGCHFHWLVEKHKV